jgi:hypothetical protein
MANNNEEANGLSEKMAACPFFAKKASSMLEQGSESPNSDLTYNNYLQLDKILNAQAPVTLKYNVKAHDEHLFIIIHQGMLIFLIDMSAGHL